MKILQISSASSFGGGERYVADLTNALAMRGHDLYVALRPHSPLSAHLRLPPEKIKTLPLRNALDAPSARELARFVQQHQIDVVHAHMARDYSLAAYATRRGNAKFIVTRHVLFRLNPLHRRTLARAKKVICVSRAVARELGSQRIVNESQITVVSNGIDVDRFAKALERFDRAGFLQKHNLPSGVRLVGTVGELRALKRHDDFIRAAAIVAQNLPDTHFVVAGVDTSRTGEVSRRLQQLAARVGLEDRCHFLGWLPDAELLLCALDVFVSASETESFGLAIAEAMAAGAAVVATKTEGAMEVVEDQKTGLLIPIGDVTRMAESITALLKDENRRRAMGAGGQRRVKERFSLGRMVDQIEKIYQSV